jgi:hypothetical protein
LATLSFGWLLREPVHLGVFAGNQDGKRVNNTGQNVVSPGLMFAISITALETFGAIGIP